MMLCQLPQKWLYPQLMNTQLSAPYCMILCLFESKFFMCSVRLSPRCVNKAKDLICWRSSWLIVAIPPYSWGYVVECHINIRHQLKTGCITGKVTILFNQCWKMCTILAVLNLLLVSLGKSLIWEGKEIPSNAQFYKLLLRPVDFHLLKWKSQILSVNETVSVTFKYFAVLSITITILEDFAYHIPNAVAPLICIKGICYDNDCCLFKCLYYSQSVEFAFFTHTQKNKNKKTPPYYLDIYCSPAPRSASISPC